MSNLIIQKHLITGDMRNILLQISRENGNKYFKSIKSKGDNLSITCPVHKDGQESHPSCNIYIGDSPDIVWGFCKCFTCGYKATLPELVAYCYGKDIPFAESWLIENYGNTLVEEAYDLPEITKPTKQKFLDEGILKNYEYYHPYMWKRKLSKEIVDMFEVGYNPISDALTFPVRDIHNRLVMITERSVNTKLFHLEANVEKPVYLLNEIIKRNIKSCIVCESQINALTAWTYGYPAVALFGTGSKYQYEILNKSGVRVFNLCFDGDDAGKKGCERFKKSINSSCIINTIEMPAGLDLNDCTKEFFDSLYQKSQK